MTLDEIVYNIKSLATGGNPTGDSKLSNRQIEEWIHYHRLSLLESYTNNGRNIPYSAVQLLGKFVIPEEKGLELPNIASFGGTKAITSITLVDGDSAILRTTKDKALYQTHNRFTANATKVYIEGSLMYFTGNEGDEIEISGVLEDPTDLKDWNRESAYPIPTQLIPALMKAVAEVELNITIKTPNDFENDNLEVEEGLQQKKI